MPAQPAVEMQLYATAKPERILLLDALRGIAVLGILLMNMPFFSIPYPASENPFLLDQPGTINFKIWYVVSWFFDGTQRALFSMLFGAGIILFVTRLQKKLSGSLPVEYFIRRQLWLIFFGLINAYVFLWPGDILFQYGCVGIIAFAFYRAPVKGLIMAAVVCLLLMTARENKDFYTKKNVVLKGLKVQVIDTAKTKLTEKQKEDMEAMLGMKKRSDTASLKEEMQKNKKAILGNYTQLYKEQSGVSAMIAMEYTYYGLWDVLIFMFIGMAFFKTGIITGKASIGLYGALTVLGLGIGLTLTYFMQKGFIDVKYNFFEILKTVKFSYYEISRTFRSLGLFGLIMLLYKSGLFKWLFKLFQPVGQMAFTNYLSQSILCGFIFFGVGLGFYGKLERYEIYILTGLIWCVQIAFSHVWLTWFRFGPFEWLWRSLTYWKIQPMRK